MSRSEEVRERGYVASEERCWKVLFATTAVARGRDAFVVAAGVVGLLGCWVVAARLDFPLRRRQRGRRQMLLTGVVGDGKYCTGIVQLVVWWEAWNAIGCRGGW
jgi:hypothetical protein